MPEQQEKPARNRKRDFWQLDVPLIIVLGICISATVIEVSRAGDGNWRAAVYSIEWPLIGAFAIWMWVRFKREGGSFRGITQRWQDRVAQYEAEAANVDTTRQEASTDADPQLAEWNRYRAEVREQDRAEGRG